MKIVKHAFIIYITFDTIQQLIQALIYRISLNTLSISSSGSQGVLGPVGQGHPALRGSQQLYQHHQYANFNNNHNNNSNNNNNSSSGRFSANGRSSPGTNYLVQQHHPDNYHQQQQTSRYSSSSTPGGGRHHQQIQQTLTPTGRRDNLDNGR